MFPIVSLLILTLASSSKVVLDGTSVYPASQSVTYRWACPDGRVTIEIAQTKGSSPSVERATYASASIAQQVRTPINAAIKHLRTVESISPHCLTSGGISLIFAGLSRDEVPAKRQMVAIKISRTGEVSAE